MAGTTRLELATSAVTGQRSNQLNYVPALAQPPEAQSLAVGDRFRSGAGGSCFRPQEGPGGQFGC